jgi:hypothetical protein
MIVPLLAATITLQGMLEHDLAKHAHIMDAVRIQTEEFSPAETHWMQLKGKFDFAVMPDGYLPPVGWVYKQEWGWMIGVRKREFKTLPFRLLEWVVMHEVCHVIQDRDWLDKWDKLTDLQRNQREENANTCASAMQKQHDRCH